MNARNFLTALLAVGSLAVAAKPSLADPGIYERLVDSAVMIRVPGVSAGSGTVIDAQNKLVITNYHVVGEADEAEVYFAAFDGNGELVKARTDYYTHAKTLQSQGLAMMGKVVARWASKDLALVKLPELPADAVAIPLASQAVAPGEAVHSVGCPGASDALWVYSPGQARMVSQQLFSYSDGQRVEARIIDMTSPINPGDSGSGMVNARGELVGVVCGNNGKGRLLSMAVDLTEVKNFVNKYYNALEIESPVNTWGAGAATALVGDFRWPQ